MYTLRKLLTKHDIKYMIDIAIYLIVCDQEGSLELEVKCKEEQQTVLYKVASGRGLL